MGNLETIKRMRAVLREAFNRGGWKEVVPLLGPFSDALEEAGELLEAELMRQNWVPYEECKDAVPEWTNVLVWKGSMPAVKHRSIWAFWKTVTPIPLFGFDRGALMLSSFWTSDGKLAVQPTKHMLDSQVDSTLGMPTPENFWTVIKSTTVITKPKRK